MNEHRQPSREMLAEIRGERHHDMPDKPAVPQPATVAQDSWHLDGSRKESDRDPVAVIRNGKLVGLLTGFGPISLKLIAAAPETADELERVKALLRDIYMRLPIGTRDNEDIYKRCQAVIATQELHCPATGERLEKPSWAELGAQNEELERVKQLQAQVDYEKGQRKLLWDSFQKLEQQRDELLAACKAAKEFARYILEDNAEPGFEECIDIRETCATAIARTEGRAQS